MPQPVSLILLLLQQLLLDASPQLILRRLGIRSSFQLFLCLIFAHQVLDDGVKHLPVAPAAKELWGAAPVRSRGAGNRLLGGPGAPSPFSSLHPLASSLPLCLSHEMVALSFAMKKNKCLYGRRPHTVVVDSLFREVVPSGQPPLGLASQGCCRRCTLQEALQLQQFPQRTKEIQHQGHFLFLFFKNELGLNLDCSIKATKPPAFSVTPNLLFFVHIYI